MITGKEATKKKIRLIKWEILLIIEVTDIIKKAIAK